MYYLLSFKLLTLSEEDAWENSNLKTNAEERQNFAHNKSNILMKLPNEIVSEVSRENTLKNVPWYFQCTMVPFNVPWYSSIYHGTLSYEIQYCT